MSEQLRKELGKLEAEVQALLSLMPAAQRLVAKPVAERLLRVIRGIAEEI